MAARQVPRRTAYAGEGGGGREGVRESLVQDPERTEQRERPEIEELIWIAAQQVNGSCFWSQKEIFSEYKSKPSDFINQYDWLNSAKIFFIGLSPSHSQQVI